MAAVGRATEQRLRRFLAEALFFTHGLRVLVRPTLALIVTGGLGAAVFRETGAAESWPKAGYLAYEMLMGEFSEFPEHPAAQIATFVMPLVGILFVAEGVIKLGFSAFRKQDNLEVWMSMVARTADNHVILCGLGTVGYRILEELRELGETVLVIERDPQNSFVALARSKGVEVTLGDARAENLLKNLNLGAARAIIVATNDDLANLEIAMDVREISKDIPILLRLFDQRLADKVKHLVGIELSVSTSKLAAPLFASAALDRRVVGTHRVGNALLVVLELNPKPDSPLVGRSVGQIHAERNVTVLAAEGAEGWALHPASGHIVAAGRKLQVVLPGQRVRETLKWG